MTWEQRHMQYDKYNNTVYIDAYKYEFYPKFLDYVLESKSIPIDCKKVFLRDAKEAE